MLGMMPPDNPNAAATTAEDADLLNLLRLHLVNGIGPRHSQLLLDHFGSAEAVFSASLAQLEEMSGIGPKIAMSIAASKIGREAEQELEDADKLNVQLLRRGSADYPKAIERICDPPLLLYCKGNFEPRDELAVAIVGSRRCTVYGRQQAEKFATALARAGVTIVSGLARHRRGGSSRSHRRRRTHDCRDGDRPR